MRTINRMFGTAKIYMHFSFLKREKHLVLILFIFMVSVPALAQPDVQLPSAEAIDLGLPSGTRWASCNVGATKPEEFGGKYAWGESEEKSDYTEENYLYKGQNLGSNISGTQYDVAHVKWGGNWQMPTKKQIEELKSKCTVEEAVVNGVSGVNIIGPNGNVIFFPILNAGWGEEFWSGTPFDDEDSAYALSVSHHGSTIYSLSRWHGYYVRPVEVSNMTPPILTVNPEDIAFGIVKYGTEKAKALTVTNTSNASLKVTMDGCTSSRSNFDVSDNQEEVTLAPGKSKVYTVTAHGTKAGYAPTQSLLIKCEGLDEDIEVKMSSYGDDDDPIIDVTELSLNVGEISSVKVKESGYFSAIPDDESIIKLSGGGGPGTSGGPIDRHHPFNNYSESEMTVKALKAGVAHVTFTDLHTNHSSVLNVSVTDGSAAPTISITPSVIDFGVVEYGKDKTETFMVTNTGNSNLTFHVDGSTEFTSRIEVSDNMTTYMLAPGDSKVYNVIAHGLSAGYEASTLIFVKSDSSDEETKVRVTCIGDDDEPLIDNTSFTMAIGEKASIRIKTPYYSIEEDLEGIVDCVGGGPGASEYWDKDHDSYVKHSQIGLTFTALKAGVVHITFKNKYSDQTEVLTITVTGDSAVPAISITPSEIDFGVVEYGKDKTETFTVTNTGNASLTFHVSQAAESNKYFDISDAEEEYTLAPGNSKDYTITCHGLKKGYKAWVDFRILSDAENGEQTIRVNSVGWDSTPLLATNSLTMNVGDKKSIEMHGSNMGTIEIINNNPDIVSVIKGSDTGGGGSIGFDGEYRYGYTSLYINALAQGTATVKVVDTGVNEEAILTITVTDKSQEPIGMEPRMIVWHKDGTKVYFALSDSPKITYEGEKVFIKGSSMVELDYQSIKKITYETEEDIIDKVKDHILINKKPFKNNDETITFLPAKENLHVRVVSLNGMVIKDFVVRKGETSTVTLSSFSTNVYLIVVNGVTYKIAIR